MVQDGTPPIKTFEHVPSEIGAEEAEEVGVEHLLRYNFAIIFMGICTYQSNQMCCEGWLYYRNPVRVPPPPPPRTPPNLRAWKCRSKKVVDDKR